MSYLKPLRVLQEHQITAVKRFTAPAVAGDVGTFVIIKTQRSDLSATLSQNKEKGDKWNKYCFFMNLYFCSI
jgi:hypothetical protein